MELVQVSLENLIKTNNGLFKSEAQAEFLLSKLKEEFGNEFFQLSDMYKEVHITKSSF